MAGDPPGLGQTGAGSASRSPLNFHRPPGPTRENKITVGIEKEVFLGISAGGRKKRWKEKSKEEGEERGMEEREREREFEEEGE